MSFGCIWKVEKFWESEKRAMCLFLLLVDSVVTKSNNCRQLVGLKAEHSLHNTYISIFFVGFHGGGLGWM